MATHARSGTARWVAGSVAETLLERTPVPLLLVRDDAGEHELLVSSARPRIMVPLDGSVFAEAALPAAGELARRLDGQLVLLQAISVWDDLVAGNSPMGREVHELEHARSTAQAYLDAIVSGGLLGECSPRPRTLVVEGSPAQVIAAAARTQRAALGVMATHGHTGLVREQPGTHAAATLRATTMPLLLVRPALPVLAHPGG
jgi:nucleotide-binding universal stress UspA family protein